MQSGHHLICSLSFRFAVDIISAIEFDKTGDHLATGDRGGRVVLFERTDTKEVCFSHLTCFLYYFYFLIFNLPYCFLFVASLTCN